MRPALVYGVMALLVSAGAVKAQEVKPKRSVYGEIAEAPKKAREKPNPLDSDPEAVTAGALLYQRHCAECHGEKAAGKKGPSLLAPEVQEASPGTLFWVLTNGVVRKGMPVWSKLPEAQRWQLVSFLKSLKAPANEESAEVQH